MAWGDVVNSQRQLLITVVVIEIAVLEVGLSLGGNHLPHQLYGGVDLTTVTATLGTNVNARQLLGAVEPLGRVGIDISIQLRIHWHAQQKQEQ